MELMSCLAILSVCDVGLENSSLISFSIWPGFNPEWSIKPMNPDDTYRNPKKPNAKLFTRTEYMAAVRTKIQLTPATALIPSQDKTIEATTKEITIVFFSFPPIANSRNEENTNIINTKEINVYIDLFHFRTPLIYKGHIRHIAKIEDINPGLNVRSESHSQPICVYLKNDMTPDIKRNISDNMRKVLLSSSFSFTIASLISLNISIPFIIFYITAV